MTGNKSSLLILRLVLVTLIVFLIVLPAAMLAYPDKNGRPGGYPFFYEYLSAMGMTRTHAGIANLPSCLLFNIGLGTAMLMLIPFWRLRVQCMAGKRYWQRTAFICGTAFSLGILGVALTPYNLMPRLHDFSVHSALIIIVPGGLLMIALADQNYWSRSYKWGWTAFAILLFAGELTAQIMVKCHLLPSRPTGPVMQKVNVAVFIVWLTAELFYCRRYFLRPESVPAVDADDCSIKENHQKPSRP